MFRLTGLTGNRNFVVTGLVFVGSKSIGFNFSRNFGLFVFLTGVV